MPEAVAIVLGAVVRPDGSPSPTLRRRAARAAQLFAEGKVARIVASGGDHTGPISEAEAVARELRVLGVPDRAILRETRAGTTRENIAFSLELLPASAVVILVSDAWHLPRARLIARRLGRPAHGVAAGWQGTSLAGTARLMLREAFALAWELLRPAP